MFKELCISDCMCTSLGGIPMPTPQCSGNIAGRGHKSIRVRKWGELL